MIWNRKNMGTNVKSANAIRVERVFDADIKLMWKVWTEPQYIKRWFGSDPNGTVEEVTIDLKIAGGYKISFSDSDGSQHTCKGRFISIIEHKLLISSWEWESEPGHISELSVSFQSLGKKTKVVLIHSNLNPDSRHAYEEGWTRGLMKIERILIK